MEKIILKKKEEKETLRDCVVYLLNLCDRYKEDERRSKLCLDVAKKALFLYNLSPTSFGSESERKGWLDAINKRIRVYESNEMYHLK